MRAGAVVCGAGIAGISTAFHLVRAGVEDVVLVDPLPPMSLTSDKSTECYRNWWPQPDMAALMNRSIDLLERYAAESNAFRLHQRGYVFVTSDRKRLEDLERDAIAMGDFGVEFHGDGQNLRSKFPYLSESAVGGLHALRAGWFSAQQFGSWMLESVTVVRGEVTGVHVESGQVETAVVDGQLGISTPFFVNAAGPMLARVGHLLDLDLPVHTEVHLKVGFRDYEGVVPRDAPMLIWLDPQVLEWSEEEQANLRASGRSEVLGVLPEGCHGRPEGDAGSPWMQALWEYRRIVQEPTWPLPEDRLYPEMVMRGMTTMIPGLSVYRDHLPQPVVDGGYYTKTDENLPLIGPLPVEGAYVVGALSGFGVMAAAAAGELAALHITGGDLPSYAGTLSPSRYQDPAYRPTVSDQGQI